MDDLRITSEANDPVPTLRSVAETGIQTPPRPLSPPADPSLQRDREHLDTLSAFHYILCGLQCLGLVMMPLYAVYIYFVFISNALPLGSSPFPPEAGWIIEGFLGVFFFLTVVWAVCLGLTGRDLRRRQHPTFCFVIACIQCIHVPLGTLLGIFTILVLQRESVKERFRTGEPVPAPEDEGPRLHPYEERRKDRQWLSMLSICHFVLAGFLSLFGVLGVIYLMLGIFMLTTPPPPQRPGGPPPPPFVILGWIMIGLATFLFVLFYGQALMAGLTGYYIRKRKRWKFCLVGAGVECLNAPFGMILCGFTVFVLMRESVRDLFKHGEPLATTTDEDYV